MRLSDIEQFVSSHADWIAQRRASIERARPDLSDGAVISLCGVSCTIAQRAQGAAGRGRAVSAVFGARARIRFVSAQAHPHAHDGICRRVCRAIRVFLFCRARLLGPRAVGLVQCARRSVFFLSYGISGRKRSALHRRPRAVPYATHGPQSRVLGGGRGHSPCISSDAPCAP